MPGNYYSYDLEITPPDAAWALFTVNVGGEPDALHSVPVDAGNPLKLLNSTAIAGARLHYFRLSADGRYAVYRAEEDYQRRLEIYSARWTAAGRKPN